MEEQPVREEPLGRAERLVQVSGLVVSLEELHGVCCDSGELERPRKGKSQTEREPAWVKFIFLCFLVTACLPDDKKKIKAFSQGKAFLLCSSNPNTQHCRGMVGL